MTETQAREEICRVGRSLFDRGFVHATAGNISVRLDDGFLITPTDACLGFLDPARLAKLDLQGQQISGDKGSKTIALHRRIYAAACAHDGLVVGPREGQQAAASDGAEHAGNGVGWSASEEVPQRHERHEGDELDDVAAHDGLWLVECEQRAGAG